MMIPKGINSELEIWKDIIGFESKYQVSNQGRIKSLKRESHNQFTKIDIILKSMQEKKTGYMFVNLHNDGKRRKWLIHILVAKHFCEGYKKGLSSADNTKKGWVDGLYIMPKGEKHYNSKLIESDIIEIRKQRGNISQRKLAKRYSVTQYAILAIQLRRTWKHVA